MQKKFSRFAEQQEEKKKKEKEKGRVMLPFPGAARRGEGEEGGQFDFEHIRCAAEPVTAVQGRTENSALHLLKVGCACFAGRLQPEVTGLSYERGI